jgi:hypothetical protein
MRKLGRALLKRSQKLVVHLATDYTWTFVLVILTTLISTAFSIQYLTTIESRILDVYENDVRGGDSVQTALMALLSVENSAKDLVLSSNLAERGDAAKSLNGAIRRLQASVNEATPRFYTPKAKSALLTTQAELQRFLVTQEAVVAGGDKTPDSQDLRQLKAAADRLRKDLELLISNRTANSTKGIEGLLDQLRLTLVLTIVVLVLTIVIRLVMYWAGHPNRTNSAHQTDS